MEEVPGPVSVKDWLDVVKRARLGKAVKAIAKELATFADYDTGLNCRPGLARLAHEAEYSYEATIAAVARLRVLGLIRKVGVWHDADVYRLTLPDASVFKVPSPTQHEAAIEKIRAKQRGTYMGGGRKNKKRLPREFLGADAQEDTVCPEENKGQTEMSAPSSTQGRETSAPNFTEVCPLKFSGLPIDHSLEVVPTSTPHSDIDLFAAVTDPSGPGRETDEDSPAAVSTPDAEEHSHRCPHGNNRRRCVPCRAAKRKRDNAAADSVTTPDTRRPNCEHGFAIIHRSDGQLACPTCRQTVAAEAFHALHRSQPAKESTA